MRAMVDVVVTASSNCMRFEALVEGSGRGVGQAALQEDPRTQKRRPLSLQA